MTGRIDHFGVIIGVMKSLVCGLLLVGVLLSPIAMAEEAGAAVNLPKSGLIELTGYEQLGPSGSTGPITVAVSGKGADSLRKALESDLDSVLRPRCSTLEGLQAFEVDVLPRRGAAPTLTAKALECGPLILSVAEGPVAIEVPASCKLWSAALAALPRGTATGTRKYRSE